MQDSLVSIIIPSYNRSYLIKETLLSVVSQTYRNWECIVVDDGSTDSTTLVVQEFIDQDIRFKYFTNQRKKGAQGARNTGILKSKGEWICFLDSDDYLLDNSIKDRIDSWEKAQCHDDIALVYGDFLNCEFQKINGSAYQWMIKNMALCPFSVMLVRNKKVFTDDLLDERFPAWQDDDFVFNISTRYDVLHCGKVIAEFGPSEKADSISMSKKRIIEGLSLMINKRKKVLMRDGGTGRLIVWYLRLLTLKLELFRNRNIFFNNKNALIRKVLDLIIRLMRKMLSYKFDVIYV